MLYALCASHSLTIHLTQDDIDASDHSNHIGDQTPFNHP
jgi:hypothetical protein